MIFIDFPDHHAEPGETPPQSTIGPELVNWAKTAMLENSYGKTALDVAYDDQWLRMSKNAGQYDWVTNAGGFEIFNEAIALADPGFDFSGRQTLYVVAAPTGPPDFSGVNPTSPALIATSGDLVNADGTDIRWGASFGDDARFPDQDYGAEILVHETGHTFGFPDLYEYGNPSYDGTHRFVGAWDHMGAIRRGQHFNGWHKRTLGWLEPAQWSCVSTTPGGVVTATLSPVAVNDGLGKILVAKTSSTVAYVAEVRMPVPGTLDASIAPCSTGGVIVYRIDNKVASGSGPVRVKPAAPDPGALGGCEPHVNAPFAAGQTFSENGVTVEVLSQNDNQFTVRMTGPELAEDPDDPADDGPGGSGDDKNPGPGGGGAEDRLGLKASGPRKQRVNRRGEIKVKARCSISCLITAGGKIVISRRAAARPAAAAKRIKLVTAKRSARAGTTYTLKPRVKGSKKQRRRAIRSIKRALRRGAAVARINVRASAAGQTVRATRKIKLKR